MRSNPSGQSGFSLIELMIAMVVTLVISASIYGLIAQSNTAFKIQPELADRQQNIRVAMDVIQRDLQGAGVNLGLGYQVFQQALSRAQRGRLPIDRGVCYSSDEHVEVT